MDNLLAFAGIFSADGRVRAVNRLALEAAGVSLDDVVGLPFEAAPWWRDLPTSQAQVRNVIARVAAGEVVRLDLLMRDRAGDVRVVEASFAPVRDGEGRVVEIIGSGVDVTARKRAVAERQALLEREQEARAVAEAAHRELRAVLERVSDGFVALDRSWIYTYVNRHAASLFGRRPEDLLGKHIWTEFPEGVGQPFHLAYERAMREQRFIELQDLYEPWNRWFENRIYPSPDGVAIFFHEITESKLAEQELLRSRAALRALAARLEAVREEEGVRISRELHDQVGQAMTALRMDLTQLEREAGAGPLDRERLRAMRELIDATLASARRIAAELRPAILDDLGLAAAVEQVAADFERRASIACAAHVPDGGADMDRRAALALYRILQEALTNVARHAGATRVDITLSVEDGTVALVVTDDGRGFEPEAAGADATRPSLGLLGMRERALALGGELRVDARPGQGTAVSARVPRRPPGPGDGSP
jgi:hypothetical protein